jgi:hypothetical protein
MNLWSANENVDFSLIIKECTEEIFYKTGGYPEDLKV